MEIQERIRMDFLWISLNDFFFRVKRHGDLGASAVGSTWFISGAEGLSQLQWPRALEAGCSEALEAWCRRKGCHRLKATASIS